MKNTVALLVVAALAIASAKPMALADARSTGKGTSELDRVAVGQQISAWLKSYERYNIELSEWDIRRLKGAADLGPQPSEPRVPDALRAVALQAVEANPIDDIGFNAIYLILISTSAGIPHNGHLQGEAQQLNDKMIRLLLSHHSNRELLQTALNYARFTSPVTGAQYWVEVYETSTDEQNKALALSEIAQRYFDLSNTPGIAMADRDRYRNQTRRYAKSLRDSKPALKIIGPGMAESILAALETSAGATMPRVTAKTVEGQDDALESYRGKVVLLDFWTTWCGPCKAAHPQLIELKKSLAGKPFEIIGISADDKVTEVTRYLKQKRQLPWVNWFVGPEAPMLKQLGVLGFPTYILIDTHGIVYTRGTGDAGLSNVEAQARELLRTAG